MPEIVKKRRRPAVSCTLCRRRKIKCDRVLPCRNCVKSGNAHCTFDADTLPPTVASDTQHHLQLHSPPLSTPSPSQAPNAAALSQKWVHHNRESGPCTPATINTATSSIGGTVHMHITPTAVGHGTQTKSIMHKSRVFGQSYWFNGVAPLLLTLEIMEPLIHHGGGSTIVESLQKCKTLGRQIKQVRTPSWPCALSTSLPDRTVVDALLGNYLRTSESVYRIIHIPTFRQAYESLWISGSPPPIDSFLIQLKLIMAIGAVTYDDCFSLRSDAIRWIYEAKTWLSDPRSKSKPSIQVLQVNLLLLLAQELLHVEGDPSWVATGAIVRKAMHFGLHRDPDTLVTMSVFAAETRRRLWNTVLELAVQSALAAGGAPLISMDDFDTKPPGNYDDEDLLSGTPVAKPMSEFTASSVAIVLRSTFAARLAVTRHLNDLASTGHYQETLRIDADLKETFRTMRRSIQQYITDERISRSCFEVNAVEFIANRYLSALHIPFYGASMQDPGYTYSRQTVVEISLKIWRAIYAEPGKPEPVLARWALCGMGFFRLMAMQASLLIPLELRAQMEEDDDSLGPKSPRQDLLDVVNQSVTWSKRCCEIGDTNVKGYLLAAVVGAHVNSIANGVEKANIPQMVLQNAEVTIENGIRLLENSLEREQSREGVDAQVLNTDWEAGDVDVQFSTGDWDALMSEALLQVGDGDPMAWLLDAAGGAPGNGGTTLR